jgi:anti-anti-sigma regulatory factor
MPGVCSIQRERQGARTVFRVSGVFDRASALELRRTLDEDPGDELVLDFSLVREFADLGIATLASGLCLHRRLRLLGLRQHQERLFRYFGVDVEALRGAPAAH